MTQITRDDAQQPRPHKVIIQVSEPLKQDISRVITEGSGVGKKPNNGSFETWIKCIETRRPREAT